jgi:surface protein
MSYMFLGATSLKNQDFSSWNVDNVISHRDFSNGDKEKNIVEPNWKD